MAWTYDSVDQAVRDARVALGDAEDALQEFGRGPRGVDAELLSDASRRLSDVAQYLSERPSG